MSRKEEYRALLLDPRWNEKRNKILKRDMYKCQHCFSMNSLHVHHLIYKANCLPWEYSCKDLLTLCQSCHEKVHKNFKIKIVKKDFKIKTSKIEKLKMKLSKRDLELQARYDSIKAKL